MNTTSSLKVFVNDVVTICGEQGTVLNVRNGQAHVLWEDGYSDWYDYSEIDEVRRSPLNEEDRPL